MRNIGNIGSEKNSYFLFSNSTKKSQNDYLGTTTEISHIMNEEENLVNTPNTPKLIIEEED